MTTGAIIRAKLQSNHHHQQTNTELFTCRMLFLSPNQQCQSTGGKTTLKFWWEQYSNWVFSRFETKLQHLNLHLSFGFCLTGLLCKRWLKVMFWILRVHCSREISSDRPVQDTETLLQLQPLPQLQFWSCLNNSSWSAQTSTKAAGCLCKIVTIGNTGSKGKGKIDHAPQQSIGGCSSPSPRPDPVGGEPLCLWRVASATPDLQLCSKLQGITAQWLVPNYTAWLQRHMCVNNLPRVAVDSGVAGIRTRDLLITGPASYCYATKPLPAVVKCN